MRKFGGGFGGQGSSQGGQYQTNGFNFEDMGSMFGGGSKRGGGLGVYLINFSVDLPVSNSNSAQSRDRM
ncbi:MAG: hypothetical protein U5R06_23990 [candidate division KSB1 bacterium]|nr:hypothetical protein [candidate division KSB1 bacterium]